MSMQVHWTSFAPSLMAEKMQCSVISIMQVNAKLLWDVACRAEYGVIAEWSPNGRMLLVATTAPRLRVDNGLTLYRCDGALLSKQPYEVVYSDLDA